MYVNGLYFLKLVFYTKQKLAVSRVFNKLEVVDLMVPNVSCTHVSCTLSACLPITIVSSLNPQAARRLYLLIKTYIQYYICFWNYFTTGGTYQKVQSDFSLSCIWIVQSKNFELK